MSNLVFTSAKQRTVKKGKIVFLALAIVLSFLFHTWFGPLYPLFENPFLLSLFYALFSMLGFMWVLQFKLNFKIVSLIAPSLGLVIFTQMLFVQVFFQGAFGRVYEMLLMVVIMFLIFVITYLAFLTSNVFAVSSFRRIPLEAVAKTSIYFISVLSVFFITYALLALEVEIILSIIFLLLGYVIYAIFLLMHFYVEFHRLLVSSLLVFWNVTLIFFAGLLFGAQVEFIALLVSIVFYYSSGLFIEKRQKIPYAKLIEYFFILIIAIFSVFYLGI